MMDGARVARWTVLVVAPAVVVGLQVVAWLSTWGDLPDPIANHFALDGTANGTMAQSVNVVFQLVPALAVVVWLVHTGLRPTPDAAAHAATASFIGIFTGGIWLIIALANEGHTDWQDVRIDNSYLAGAIVVAGAWAVIVGALARRIAAPRPKVARRDLPLAGAERAAWFGHTSGAAFLVAGGLLLATGLAIILLRDELFAGVVVIAVGLTLAVFVSVDITVSERGVHVRSGLLPLMRVRLPLGRIESAQAVDVRPLRWGGWGYRGSLRLFRWAAWVLRAGPGLELQLTGGQRFVVTVDDADEAAAVVNGLIARAT